MPPTIVGQKGPKAGESFTLDDRPLTFGRSPDNRVVIPDNQVSRRHAEIRREGENYFLSDLQSPNGTRVNGERIKQPVMLQPGNTIEIGNSAFQFQAPPELNRAQNGLLPFEVPTSFPAPRLICIQGPHNGATFILNEPSISFGRAASNQVRLTETRSSRHHAEIRREGANYVIYDLGSQNGTIVNGETLTRPRSLKPGDRISFSGEIFLFLVEVEAAVTGKTPLSVIEPLLTLRAKPNSQVLQFGIECPGPCGRSWPLDLTHCPVDGFLLANGNSQILSSSIIWLPELRSK